MTLIDKAALLNRIATEVHYDSERSLEMYAKLLSEINDAPDALIRCKDCKWCHAGYCEKADDIIPFGFAHREWENFYCAWGEKRKDE